MIRYQMFDYTKVFTTNLNINAEELINIIPCPSRVTVEDCWIMLLHTLVEIENINLCLGKLM